MKRSSRMSCHLEACRMHHALVVDDNDEIRYAIIEMLALEGVHAVHACDAQQAAGHLAAGHVPFVLVLDSSMPGVDGWELLEWLRHSPHRELPVIVLTALAFDGDAAQLAARYGCSVMRKTGDLRRMVEAVAALHAQVRPMRSSFAGWKARASPGQPRRM